MGSLLTCYVPEDIKLKLKQEENVSALITRLLYQYFESKVESINEVKNKLNQLEYAEITELQRLKKEQEKLKIKLQEIEDKDKETEIKNKKQLMKEQEFEINVRKNFKFFTGLDMDDITYCDFKQKWDDNTITGIQDYISLIGLKGGGDGVKWK
jgi:hypothetical protein